MRHIDRVWNLGTWRQWSPRLCGETKIIYTIGDRIVGNVFSPSFSLFLVLVFQNGLYTENKQLF